MSTYKIIVEFSREESDDVEVVKDKYGDARMHDKLAAQLAVELQATYLLPECELGGHFEIMSVGGVEIDEKGQALASKEANAWAEKELARHEKARKAPGTFEGLMNRLHRLSPGCSTGEDNDGQIVVYTNLKEVDGKLVDLDALEEVVQQRKLKGIVTEVTTVEKHVEVEVPKEWVTTDHQKIENAIKEEVSESEADGEWQTKVQVSWEVIG